MLKKVTIKKVFVADKNKAGESYVYKNGKNAGKNFVRVSIQTEETGEEYYSNNCMIGSRPTKLEVGEKVLLKLVDDGDFKNFMFPTAEEMNDFINQIDS